MFAVIKTGGKQYRVAAADVIQVEKLAGETGDTVVFGEVLMLGGEQPAIGAPLVAGASVAGEIVEQKRGRKIIVFKKRRRQNSRRKNGHRQEFTLVRIAEILAGGAKPSGQARKPKKAAGAEPATAADDVGRIGGVGPKLKEKLAAAGITSLAEIAALDEAAVDKLDAELDLKGRIGRDDWVGQAKTLLADATPDAGAAKE